jgi:hypothetical protein
MRKNVKDCLFWEVRIPKDITLTSYSKTMTITTGNLPNLKLILWMYVCTCTILFACFSLSSLLTRAIVAGIWIWVRINFACFP